MTPDALAALHRRAFTAPPPWTAAAFAASLADPLTFLLTEGDAAFLLGRTVADEAEIVTLAVAPEARRRGLGRRLVARFLYQARLRGADSAFLEVAEDNGPARALYARLAFAEAGRRRGYYRTPTGQAIDALILRRALNPAADRSADPAST
jgi:ribosomal-protein-alanine N-acetyltransferase